MFYGLLRVSVPPMSFHETEISERFPKNQARSKPYPPIALPWLTLTSS